MKIMTDLMVAVMVGVAYALLAVFAAVAIPLAAVVDLSRAVWRRLLRPAWSAVGRMRMEWGGPPPPPPIQILYKPVEPSCKSCAFFKGSGSGHGWCTRHAPIVYVRPYEPTVGKIELDETRAWPSVSSTDSCGDWQRKAGPDAFAVAKMEWRK